MTRGAELDAVPGNAELTSVSHFDVSCSTRAVNLGALGEGVELFWLDCGGRRREIVSTDATVDDGSDSRVDNMADPVFPVEPRTSAEAMMEVEFR